MGLINKIPFSFFSFDVYEKSVKRKNAIQKI